MISEKTNKIHFTLVTSEQLGDNGHGVELAIDDITPDMTITDLLLYLESETDYLVIRRGCRRVDGY